jgi:hypothetical protein
VATFVYRILVVEWRPEHLCRQLTKLFPLVHDSLLRNSSFLMEDVYRKVAVSAYGLVVRQNETLKVLVPLMESMLSQLASGNQPTLQQLSSLQEGFAAALHTLKSMTSDLEAITHTIAPLMQPDA